MKVHFNDRENAPERLVCEPRSTSRRAAHRNPARRLLPVAEPEGEVYVTFPSRAFGAGSERRFFDYLRAIDGSPRRSSA